MLRDDVQLAPLTIDHADAMLAWLLDPEIRHNLGVQRHPSAEYTRAWIHGQGDANGREGWAILCQGRHVGNVVLDQIDLLVGTARFSIYVGERRFRGARVGATAGFMALERAFLVRGLHKVFLTVHAKNQPAIRSYERLGFTLEGRLREEFLLDGRRLDALRMGILRSEFSSFVGQRREQPCGV